MITIGLSTSQHAGVINEFWNVNYGGHPEDGTDASSDMIYSWIERRYNCIIVLPTFLSMTMYFEHEKDLTFFLLNHP